jgi:hypothetical protein
MMLVCLQVTWHDADTAEEKGTGAWGNCVNVTTDDKYRYVISNTVSRRVTTCQYPKRASLPVIPKRSHYARHSLHL